ncbi:MAG: UDP-glucose 4-epimerase, partial [Clostridia bacterium]|nr:UDP-glucose 4-epimerase [Clostridia bacterium]
DIATCYADPSLAEELIGFKAEKDLFDMCRDSYNWQMKNPDGFPDEE